MFFRLEPLEPNNLKLISQCYFRCMVKKIIHTQKHLNLKLKKLTCVYCLQSIKTYFEEIKFSSTCHSNSNISINVSKTYLISLGF